MTMVRCHRVPTVNVRSTSAYSDSMPPSPSLSALMISTTYLMVTTISRLQKISDSTPSTARRDIGAPAALSDASSAYSELVPMSPYTTPMAPSTAARQGAVKAQQV